MVVVVGVVVDEVVVVVVADDDEIMGMSDAAAACCPAATTATRGSCSISAPDDNNCSPIVWCCTTKRRRRRRRRRHGMDRAGHNDDWYNTNGLSQHAAPLALQLHAIAAVLKQRQTIAVSKAKLLYCQRLKVATALAETMVQQAHSTTADSCRVCSLLGCHRSIHYKLHSFLILPSFLHPEFDGQGMRLLRHSTTRCSFGCVVCVRVCVCVCDPLCVPLERTETKKIRYRDSVPKACQSCIISVERFVVLRTAKIRRIVVVVVTVCVCAANKTE
jgi:hypothetical protein